MQILTNGEKSLAEQYIEKASFLARRAECEDAHCGAVIVKDGQIIGEGFNGPPSGAKTSRCHIPKTDYHFRVTDKTCCIHAEARAVADALCRNPSKVVGSALYFVRVDERGRPKQSGDPYCTLCSKLVLDTGIAVFHLLRAEGIVAYRADEYNELSFSYTG